jgi:hypothetical protein
MPLEEVVRIGVSELMAGIGSLYVEVQDHDRIQGLLVVVEVGPATPEREAEQLRKEVGSYLRQLARANAGNRCAEEWSAVFKSGGQVVASISAHDRPPYAVIA